MAMFPAFRLAGEKLWLKPGARIERLGVCKRKRLRLVLELLEDRCLFAWSAIGPAPQQQAGGPVTGRITALAITKTHIQQAPTLFLGAAGGGVWDSIDFMTTSPHYGPLTDNFPVIDPTSGIGAGAIDVGAIAVDPNDPIGTIYIGTGEPNRTYDSRYGTGVLKSTDGGNTFQLIATGTASRPTAFFREAFSKIIVDPRSSSILYASVVPVAPSEGGIGLNPDDRIYKSTDGGVTWVELTNGGQWSLGIDVTDLDYTWNANATPPSFTLFVGIQNGQTAGGVWRTFDDGNTWVMPQNIGFATANRINRIALAADHRSGGQYVYAAVANFENNNTLESVYQSQNNGDTWTDLNPQAMVPNIGGTQGFYDLTIGLSPVTGRVYVGGQTKIAEFFIDQVGTPWVDISTGTNGVRACARSH